MASTLYNFYEMAPDRGIMHHQNGMKKEPTKEQLELWAAIGKNVDSFMGAAGFSQKKLADTSGLNKNEICAIINGKQNPTTWTLQLIAKTLGVDICQLLFSQDKPLSPALASLKTSPSGEDITDAELAKLRAMEAAALPAVLTKGDLYALLMMIRSRQGPP